MPTKKVRIEKTLESQQIADFLRLLASEIEGKSDQELQDLGVKLHGFNKLKLELIKHQGGQLSLLLKVKDTKRRARRKKASPKAKGTTAKMKQSKKPEFEDVAALKYRPLKKQLKNSYVGMRKAIRAGGLPDKAMIDEFMELSQLITAYPGFGDEHYQPFLTSCQALADAYAKNDLELFSQCYQKIEGLKKSCHEMYK